MREFEDPDHWDRAASHYQQTGHPFTVRFAEAALARVALTPESYVLDVATGTERSRWRPRAPERRCWRSTFRPAWWRASPPRGCPTSKRE